MARARRQRFDPHLVGRVLTALTEAGGQLTRTQAREVSGLPEFRLTGLLGIMRQLLNVDGCAIITDSPDVVRLDIELIGQQFGIRAE